MYMPVLIVYLAEVGLSLTKGQTAPSLALAAILVAQITKGGIGLASSLRQRATASNCSGEIKSVALWMKTGQIFRLLICASQP